MLKAIFDAKNLTKDPEVFFRIKKDKFGDVFPIYLPGAPRTLFTSNSEGTLELFSISHKVLTPPRDNPIEPVVGQNSLILLGGEKHKNEKKALTPFFFGAALSEYISLIQEVVDEELNNLNNSNFELLALTQDITIHIIISIIYGVRERNERILLKNIIKKFTDSYHPTLMFFPWSRRSVNPLWNRFKKNEVHFEEELKRLLNSNDDQKSILSKLKQIYHEDIKQKQYTSVFDQLKTMLVAGHETTAISLFWCFYYLVNNSDLYTQIKEKAENSEIDNFLEDPLVESICFEAMRIHSPVPIILRSLKEDTQVFGQHMKKGENIGVALTLLHTDESVFTNPYEFRGDRFVHNRFKMNEFAPFGGGTRKCIGSQLALLEMKITIYSFVKLGAYKILSKDVPRPIISGITMGPDKDISISKIR